MEDEMGENLAVTAHRRPLGVGRETARADGADREADVAAGEASLHPQLTLRSGLPERLGERRRHRDGLCHGWAFRRIMAFEQLRTIPRPVRTEEHTSELQSLMRISYAGLCLQKNKNRII